MTSIKELRLYYSQKLREQGFNDQTKFKCKSCQGTRKQKIEATKTKVKNDVDCFPCDGKGYHTFKEAITILVSNNYWCECDDINNIDFFDDDEHEGCIEKHHYHCQVCGLIFQIG